MRESAYIIILCGCLLFSVPLFSIGGQAVDLVKKAQEALKEYGIDPGTIDGIMGPRTKSAIKMYQLENGLPETGILDSETQKALGIPASGQSIDPKKSDSPRHQQMMEAVETHTVDGTMPSAERSPSKVLVEADAISGDGGDRVLSHKISAQGESTSKISAIDGNGDENHLSLSTIVRLVVLSVLGLAALRPVGWVLLTGGSLMIVVLMINWIGGYVNAIAYGVFACAYIIPVLFKLVLKSWDMALILALLLGIPVLLVSRYAFGSSWLISACNGFAVMTLLPLAYRRMFSKRRYRLPYGTLYYRF